MQIKCHFMICETLSDYLPWQSKISEKYCYSKVNGTAIHLAKVYFIVFINAVIYEVDKSFQEDVQPYFGIQLYKLVVVVSVRDAFGCDDRPPLCCRYAALTPIKQ